MSQGERMDEVLGDLWARLDLGPLQVDSGVDWALPAFEVLAARSTTVLLKIDGERDRNPWTIVVLGGLMGDESFRTDTDSASSALVAGFVRLRSE